MKIIKFYKPKDDYGYMSNFSWHSVELDGKKWTTSEHYFQAMKFTNEDLHKKIRSTRFPGEAAKIGRDRSNPLREDWESIKENVMMKVVLAKFTQHPDLKKDLIETGDALLVENSPVDYYWGCGKNGSGKNRLGQILMKIREYIALEETNK